MEGESVNRLAGVPLLLGALLAGGLAFGQWASASEMSSWEPVSARVIAGGVQWDANGESASAYVEYEYSVDGETYRGDRISVHATAGGKELGERFHAAELSAEPIEVFVNPEDPSEAIYDREQRWGWLAVKLLAFLILGLGGVQTLAGKSRYGRR